MENEKEWLDSSGLPARNIYLNFNEFFVIKQRMGFISDLKD
jgi:hypothetical protein